MIRNAIKAEMVRRGWNATRLADELGWHVNDVTRYLRGEHKAREDRIERMLQVLGLRIAKQTSKNQNVETSK